MSTIKITKENFEDEVTNSDKTVLIELWAPWCGPCTRISPFIDEIAREYGDIKVGKINIDEEMDLTIELDVTCIPTLFVIKNGKIINKAVGAVSRPAILKMLNK